jgi:SagB-type dehydrogenase family enzyme
LESVRSNRHGLDWPNQPLPFKIYTSLSGEPISLPRAFVPSPVAALAAIAGVDARPDLGLSSLQEVRPSQGRPSSARPDSPGEPLAEKLGLETIARLCYFSNGVTRVLRGMPFRAAACTGALYHVELYLICGDLADLEAGVYHYGAHDHALRQLRRGDFRQVLASATGAEPNVVHARVVMALTSTWWRNAWKYQARAYRHAFWDGGTILANLLAVAYASAVPARVVVGFADGDVNRLLGVDPAHEGSICLVSLGRDGSLPLAPEVLPLQLETRPLSHHEVEYPEIVEAHRASSLATGEDAAAWRTRCSLPRPLGEVAAKRRVRVPSPQSGESIETVILRRGSSRQFSHEPIALDQLNAMLEVATSPTRSDVTIDSDPYLVVNAVNGLASGTYWFNRDSGSLELLEEGHFRREAAYLDLGQELAGDAAVDVYSLVNLEQLDDRAYRAAQLSAAIEGGKLYLAAYSLGLGATGLTFFDDNVTRFFSPHAQGKSVMFLTAVGHPRRRRAS